MHRKVPTLALALVLSPLLLALLWHSLQLYSIKSSAYDHVAEIMEIQWRSSQIREGLVAINGLLLSERKAENIDSLDNLVEFYAVNVNALLTQCLAYTLLKQEEIKALSESATEIPELVSRIKSNNDKRIDKFHRIKNNVGKITTLLNTHSNGRKSVAESVRSFSAINFAIASAIVILIAMTGVIISSRFNSARYNDHVRQFSLMFSHMTVTRINGLYVWAHDSLSDGQLPNPRLLGLARTKLRNLMDMTRWLEIIAGSHDELMDFHLVPISAIFADGPLVSSHIKLIRTGVTDAWNAPVSWAHACLIIDEILSNAQDALADVADPQITIDASIRTSWRMARQLVITIRDNGIGMNATQLTNATKQFYSTKGGSSGHSGMGLFGCSTMLRTMKGQLRIRSTANVGTIVQVVFPIRRS